VTAPDQAKLQQMGTCFPVFAGTQVNRAPAPARFIPRQERFKQCPLPIRQFAWIAREIPSMLNPSGIVPGRQILHLLDKDGESHPDDIAKKFGQAFNVNERNLNLPY
jgi:hypothetical protein